MRERTEKVEILRDTWGVPHIYAESELGAIYGQGYAMAHDRLPTMMKAYRKAVGRMAEAFGPEVLRTIGEIWRVLAPGGLAFVSVAGRIHGDTEYEEIEPGTYLPQTGSEAGLPHHIFDEERLREAFGAFEIEYLERRDQGRVIVVMGRKMGMSQSDRFASGG